jgi:rare lipoprotein A
MFQTMVKRRRYPYPLLALLCAALALPPAALAGSGGSGLAGPSSGSTGPATSGTQSITPVATPGPALQSGDVTVTTTGSGITLRTRASAVLRRSLSFTGTAPAGKTIEIERSGHQTNWRWAPTVNTTVAPDGSFTATWHTNHIGRFAIRAVITSANSASSASVTPSLTTTSLTTTIYRPSKASWYGPGMYGTQTACGTTLTKSTIGVANKTLPCGMRVAIYFHGRILTVPVIDHGPYIAGRDWDLTAATAQALGIDGVATIDAVSLPTR